MFSKDLEDTYSPGRHYCQCHNALIYSKYKAKSLDYYEIYILVNPQILCDQSFCQTEPISQSMVFIYQM